MDTDGQSPKSCGTVGKGKMGMDAHFATLCPVTLHARITTLLLYAEPVGEEMALSDLATECVKALLQDT